MPLDKFKLENLILPDVILNVSGVIDLLPLASVNSTELI